jgi:hypothetical protein
MNTETALLTKQYLDYLYVHLIFISLSIRAWRDTRFVRAECRMALILPTKLEHE